MTAYRAIPPAAIDCPRCKQRLPPQDVASDSCGTWVSAFAASEVLTDEERRHDPVTRWWRVRAPCPICGEQMLLRGIDPVLFQGCDGHGFWIDADIVEHTRQLSQGVDHAAIERKRADETRVEAEQQARMDAERRRAEDRATKERAEASLAAARATASWNDEESRAEVEAVMDERFGALRGYEVTMNDYRALLERVVRLEARVAALEAEREPPHGV